jgi:hypothetical protein
MPDSGDDAKNLWFMDKDFSFGSPREKGGGGAPDPAGTGMLVL